jgi:hypothetical protein
VFLSATTCVLLLAGCGDDSSKEESSATTTPSAATSVAKSNACPAEGCKVRITDATKGPNGEIILTFDANYTPDMAHNHFHVFWDHFKPEQVSDDAERTHHVKQGDWVPTADNPYTTGEAVSVKVRESSTRVCVTAGDRDHVVVDPKLFECRDVSGLLT